MENKQNILTTSWGAPVDDDNNSLTVGPSGPVLLQDTHLIDKLAHFDRERIPERVVHAKGAGAHGYFEVTHDITMYCKAKLFNKIGKRTPVFARFSTVAGERGSPDAARDPRGFAIKHYTEEGIWDMTGNNTPIFFIRDPSKFPDFIHTQKRNPETNLPDANMVWDFASLVPESVHQYMFVFSNRGTPATFRNMNGYSSHTLKFVNAKGEVFWVKLHYKTDAGIKNLTGAEAAQMAGKDPDHATRDLREHIASGKTATWTVCAQIMPYEDGFKYKWNIFDVTKIWPHKDYPLIPFGKLVLNRNPTNYFAEVEQAAFSPGHMVPGIEPSPDRMLQARLFSYPDTHRHRLGPNYLQIPINCPFACKVSNQQRDGFMTVDGNQGSAVNYYPNSINGAPKPHPIGAIHKYRVEEFVGRYPYQHPNDDFEQPRMFWEKVLNEEEREWLVRNMGSSVALAKKDIQERWLAVLKKVHPDFERRMREFIQKKTIAKL